MVCSRFGRLCWVGSNAYGSVGCLCFFIVWGRRKLVCFVDSYDVNVETVCMLYRTGVLSYRVLTIRYHPMSTEYDGEIDQ